MSTWHEVPREDMEIHDGKVVFHLPSDDNGSVYAEAKIEDVLNCLACVPAPKANGATVSTNSIKARQSD